MKSGLHLVIMVCACGGWAMAQRTATPPAGSTIGPPTPITTKAAGPGTQSTPAPAPTPGTGTQTGTTTGTPGGQNAARPNGSVTCIPANGTATTGPAPMNGSNASANTSGAGANNSSGATTGSTTNAAGTNQAEGTNPPANSTNNGTNAAGASGSNSAGTAGATTPATPTNGAQPNVGAVITCPVGTVPSSGSAQ